MRNFLARAIRRVGTFFVWVSPPRRVFSFILGLVLFVSLGSWALLDDRSSHILYFPSSTSGRLGAEIRDLPRRFGAEDRARELVSEFLLGPANPGLLPALPLGSSLEGLMLRRGTLYVDLSPETALLPEADLKRAIGALGRSLKVGVHQVRRLVVTLGGRQPWVDGLPAAPSAPAKKP